jgi:hypothetical protein
MELIVVGINDDSDAVDVKLVVGWIFMAVRCEGLFIAINGPTPMLVA